MAVSTRDSQFEAEMEAARQSELRKALFLALLIAAIGAVTLVSNAMAAFSGDPVAIGRSLVGIVGIAAGILLRMQPQRGILVALAWAWIQIPFYAWTPAGSPTAQFLEFPLTMTSSTSVNGALISYASVGINLVGVIFAVWLRAWRDRFGR